MKMSAPCRSMFWCVVQLRPRKMLLYIVYSEACVEVHFNLPLQGRPDANARFSSKIYCKDVLISVTTTERRVNKSISTESLVKFRAVILDIYEI
jgi:hypothetical protein